MVARMIRFGKSGQQRRDYSGEDWRGDSDESFYAAASVDMTRGMKEGREGRG